MLVTLTLIQIHATLIAVALVVIDNPSLRPLGWSTATIYGLSRMLWLIMGIIWLGWLMYTLEYLQEGKEYQKLKLRLMQLLGILASVYLSTYLVLLLIS